MFWFFWKQNPALLFGTSLLVGTSSYLFAPFPWNFLFPCFWAGYLAFIKKWPAFILLFLSVLYAFCLSSDGDIQEQELVYFSPSSLKPHQSPFSKSLLYQGTLTVNGQRVPCSIHYPFSENHPKASRDYVLKGKIKKRGSYDYLVQVKEWIPVEKTWSLAEMRFQAKEALRKFLDKKLTRPRVASFLSSLLTGDVEERSLRYEFGKLGLQHILAISGFHFAILIAFCSFFLSLFLPRNPKIIVLLCLINLYFVFVGALPAVQRSYLTALFFLMGKLLKKSSTALNLLGASLFVEVILDPFCSIGLGFQLSFLSCFGILLFRPLFLPLSYAIFPKHDPAFLDRLDQHGYLVTSFLREAIAITLAVNAALLPLILLHFHTFPLLSLLYNLFFPFLVSLLLFFLLICLLIHLFSAPIASPFFSLLDFLTAQTLDLSAYPPLFLDYSLSIGTFPFWIIPFYLFALFCISLLTNTSEMDYNFNHLSFNGDRSSVG